MRSMHCMAAILSSQSPSFFYSNGTTFERAWAFATADAARNREPGRRRNVRPSGEGWVR
jgi:hypothetical protein